MAKLSPSANLPLSLSLNSLLMHQPETVSPMRLYVQKRNTRNALLLGISSLMNTASTAASVSEYQMDYITSFDIRLEKDVYYAGEPVIGCVVLENSDAIKIRGVRVFLRGRARAQWKVLKSGESRTVKDDQYLLDEKTTIWGCNKNDEPNAVQILARGLHQFNFSFQLPQCQLPCSLETKAGTVRYYVKVIIDIPYASSPQGLKYFTFIGPHIDCLEEKYLAPLTGQDHKVKCLRCCRRGTLALRVVLERSAYCCGEDLKLKAHIENHQDFTISLCTRLYQHVEYRIEQGGVAEVKSLVSMVLEHRSPSVSQNTRAKFDNNPKLPVVPPSCIGVCRLIQIYYVLKICLEDERTVPFRPSNQQVYQVTYDFCVDYVETGKYISAEFRLGSVYDGQNATAEDGDEDIILYRPVYVRVVEKQKGLLKELLDSSPPSSLRGNIHLRDGSQKSTTSNHAAEVSASNNANGDVKEHRQLVLEDSSNEIIQLY